MCKSKIPCTYWATGKKKVLTLLHHNPLSFLVVAHRFNEQFGSVISGHDYKLIGTQHVHEMLFNTGDVVAMRRGTASYPFYLLKLHH